MISMSDISILRGKGLADMYFNGGLQISGPRIYKRRSYPEWMGSDVKVKAFLLEAFPKQAADADQRARMLVWGSIIYLYFRQNWSAKDVEEHCAVSLAFLKLGGSDRNRSAIHFMISQIRRKALGLNRDGSEKSALGRGMEAKGRRGANGKFQAKVIEIQQPNQKLSNTTSSFDETDAAA